jgi:hypothetical protein
LGASMIVGKISKPLRPTCARQQSHNICLSAWRLDACPVVLCDSRQLSSISEYSVDSESRSKTRFRMNSPST